MDLFLDNALNNEISLFGFCKIPLLNKHEFDLLQNLSDNFFINKEINNGLYNSHNKNLPEINITISNQIEEITKKALARKFKNHKYFIGHFNLKKGNSDMFFHLHQDWSVVDEAKFYSLQIWIPLGHSNPENGGMFFLPQSHKFFNNYRSGSFGVPVVETQDKLIKHIVPIILSEMEAVCFFNSTFHGTFQNNTSKDRSVVLMNIVSADAPTFYYDLNKKKKQTDVYNLTAQKILSHLPELEKGNISNLSYIKSIPLPEHFLSDPNEYSLLVNTVKTKSIIRQLYWYVLRLFN